MAIDGAVIRAVIDEMNSIILGGKIEKIHQPDKDHIILTIRTYRESHRLLISASSNYPRINISNENIENPKVPSAFCMLLRKHLIGARIIEIIQPSLERIVQINFECIDELQYSNQKSIIVEIMGRNSNIIFIDNSSNKIIDCIKRIDENMSSVREVLPGVTYAYPPTDPKIDTLSIDKESFVSRIKDNKGSIRIENLLIKNLYGISPVLSREICFLSKLEPDKDIKECTEEEISILFDSIKTISSIINDKNYSPCIIYKDSAPFDFHCIDLSIYNNYKKNIYRSISDVIQDFYCEKDLKDRIKQKTGDIRKLLKNRLDRCYKKLEILTNELSDAKNSQKYKIYGDLITSNIYEIKKGDNEVKVINYYSENYDEIIIPLDPILSPSANCQKYYKQYNKSKNAVEKLKNQMQENKEEIIYLENQMQNVEKCTEEIEINEIKDELTELGYIKVKKDQKIKNKKSSSPMLYISSNGTHIYVGKNNTQNDYLTQKLAKPNDIWLHTKEIPGSHVIIKLENNQIDHETLLEAANLAAFYSKGKMSSQVPIDYTYKKYVKKPPGSKPGMVIYENNKTIYVTPNEEIIKKMKQGSQY